MRILARTSLTLLVSFAILQACGDDDDVVPPTTLLDASTRDSAPTTTIDSGHAQPDTGSPSPEAGVPDADAGTDADANEDAGTDADATSNAADAGPEPIGAGPFDIAYAGLQVGIDVRPVKTATFEPNGPLAAWSADQPYTETFALGAAKSFAPGSTTSTESGSWTNGTATFGGAPLALPAGGGVLYVVGRRPSALPAASTVAFPSSVTGLLVSDGSSTGTTAGTASVQYQADGTAKVDLTFTLSSGGLDYAFSPPSLTATSLGPTPYSFGATGTISSPTSALCSAAPGNGTCNVSVQGFLSGPNAENVAVVIHVFNDTGGAAKSLSGSALFYHP